jgi:putative PIN family toxin of toxin-antitoxin system
MFPLRLVLDTNIVVSAALKPDGLERTVFLLAIAKPARLYVSAPILQEYRDVLSRKELEIRKGLRQQFLQLVQNRAHAVAPKRRINVTTDFEDNIFLECADAARADYLVTGNKRHFPAFWKNTKIVKARELIDLVAPHLLE